MSINELIHAFEFGQKNPNATFSDYLTYQSSYITKDELNNFKDFSYAIKKLALKGQEYTFLIFKNIQNYTELDSLPVRLAGDKEYYLLTPLPGEWYSGICILHIPDIDSNNSFFHIEDWDLYKGQEGLYIHGDDELTFTFLCDDEIKSGSYWNYELFKKYNNDKPDLLKLWDENSDLYAYLNPKKLKWKTIDDLFQIIE